MTETLFVREGQQVLLTNASLYVLDLDTQPTELSLTLTSEPTNGQLVKKLFGQDADEAGSVLKSGDRITYQVNLLRVLMMQSY